MTTSLPTFTPLAAKIWEQITLDIRKQLLAGVWCSRCRHDVIITNYSGSLKDGDLLLVGKCAECKGDVARVIESA